MKLSDVLHILKRFKSPLPPFSKGGVTNPLSIRVYRFVGKDKFPKGDLRPFA
jgi:hypothetical protein